MSKPIAYVIDDDTLGRMAATYFLKGKGYFVEEFSTVDEALQRMGWSETEQTLTGSLPELIVTDNDTDSRYKGMTLLKAMKDSGVPTFLLTGDTITKEAVTEAGGPKAELLLKPLNINRFSVMLDKVFGKTSKYEVS